MGVIFILEDLEQIRLLKKKEREREHLATIGEVAAGIAHEIRNPLFGISSVAQILRMEAATRGEHRPLLDAMMSETERINRMVEELLFYGRPYSLVLSEVDLPAIWSSIILMAASEIETRRLRVKTEFSPETPTIIADAERLRQVFLNLFKNAIDATPPRGEIRIRLEPRHGDVIQGAVGIQVKDTGSGIAPEQLEEIFELFYSEKKGGSGLGLPICRKIVEGHGGRIEVESTPQKGSNFEVWLPPRPPQAPPGEARP
jgi:signal transduction histidine kinase